MRYQKECLMKYAKNTLAIIIHATNFVFMLFIVYACAMAATNPVIGIFAVSGIMLCAAHFEAACRLWQW